MREPRFAPRSVRVRVTVAATLVVGLTMTVASFALIGAVRHQLVDRLEAQSQKQIKRVATQLVDGVPPSVLEFTPNPSAGFVTIRDANGVIVKSVGVGGVASSTGPAVIMNPGTAAPGGPPFDVRFETVPTANGQFTVFAGAPLDGVHHSVLALQHALVVGLPFLLAMVAGLAWFASGRALHPVEAIRAEVEAISAGTLHRRVPEPGAGDEVSRLAHTMNAMLDRLERGSDRQRQFVADASHELRSPVSAIRAHLEVALAHPDRADWPGVAHKVLREEERLEALVTDLLLLASADEQRTPTGATDVDLLALVTEEAGRQWAAPVAVTAPEGDGFVDARFVVVGRADHLGRVIDNLLDNACAHATTAVTVTLARGPDTVTVTVDDDGPGISPADRTRVFERFTRLDPSRARVGHAGAGLGLALAKAIVEQHGGTIVVDDAPGGGARFEVTLPQHR